MTLSSRVIRSSEGETRNLASVLHGIIRRSQLDWRDGHPLYAYRTSEEELEDLRETLSGLIDARSDLSRDGKAAFCLFAAEWFVRNHRDGPWKWATILVDGLGLDETRKAWIRQRVREITRRGLAWWRQKVIETPAGSRYLATLACQGGLPLQTLRRHGAVLRRYFQEVLRQLEKYPHMAPVLVAEENDQILPSTLRYSVVYELTGQLVAAIVELRRLSKPAEEQGDDRLDYLERNVPNWRLQVPVRLDEDVARELVRGLLNEQPKKMATMALSVTCGLSLQASSVTRDLRFEPEIEESRLAELLGVSTHDLPPRMQLYLEGGGQRTAAAMASRIHQESGFRVARMPHKPLSGALASGRVQLAAVAGTKQLATVDLPGSDALPDSPWIFEQDDPHRLVGVGSIATRRQTILVALDQGTSWEPLEGAEVLRKASMPTCQREVLRVTGEIRAGDEYLIRTSVTEEQGCMFTLRGRRMVLGHGGSEVWLGMPGIEVHEADSVLPAKRIDTHEVFWRPAQSGSSWQNLESSGHFWGDVIVRAARDSEVLYQSRLTIVPEAFRISLRPGPGTAEGHLRIAGLENVSLHVAANAGIETSVEETSPGKFDVGVRVSNHRPSTIGLRLSSQEGAVAEIEAACPVPWIEVVDSAGRVRLEGVPIPAEELDGLHLQIVTAQNGQLQLTERGNRYLATPTEVAGVQQMFELPLSLIQSQVAGLLARSDSPDESVTLWVQQMPNSGPLRRITISRHYGSLRKESLEEADVEAQSVHDVLISVPDTTLESLGPRIEDLQLDVLRLGYPDQPASAEAVKTVSPGRWRIHMDRCCAGPWLVTARVGDRATLRPLRVTIRPDELPIVDPKNAAPDKKFDATVNVADYEQRRKAWDELIASMAEDLGHPAWTPVSALIKTAARMPVTTFEAVSRITQNPIAVAHVGIQRIADVWLWDSLEQLPFLWSLVPVKAWGVAVRNWVDHLETRLAEIEGLPHVIEETIQDLLKRVVELGPLRYSGMECVIACLFAAGLRVPTSHSVLAKLLPNAKAELNSELEQQRTRLVADHIQDRWPTRVAHTSAEVCAFASQFGLRERPGFQKAVLDAPLIAAAHSILGVAAEPELVAVLQELKGFHPIWFDNANSIAMYLMAGDKLSVDPKYFHLS